MRVVWASLAFDRATSTSDGWCSCSSRFRGPAACAG